MPRSLRQSKILELISLKEICTQDELVDSLRELDFDVTQATISRDIKELGLIKKISPDTGKSRYVFPENDTHSSNKFTYILKESVISIKILKTFVVIKVLRNLAQAVSNVINNLNIENMMGSVYGDDCVMLIFSMPDEAVYAKNRIEGIINC